MQPTMESQQDLPPDGLGPHATRHRGRNPTRDRKTSAPRDHTTLDAKLDRAARATPSEQASEGQKTAQYSGARDDRLEFIALAAHELRGPLTTIKGYAQLVLLTARKDANFPERSRRALQAIDQQTSRMADMVAELLDATRLQQDSLTLRPQLVELSGIVRHAVGQRAPALEHHTIEIDSGGETLTGMWDAPHIEQTIRALLDNAIRFSPNGGAIGVSMSRMGSMARVCISDPGIGVADVERERIFEPFYCGALPKMRHLSGLGVGLYVARAVAEQLGGRLWLDVTTTDETQATGSRFCLELPLADA